MGNERANNNSTGSFYEPTSATVALERYMKALGSQNLYSAQKNKAILRLLREEQFEGKRVLDLGCGGGLWTTHFLERGATVVCCDVREHLIEAARLHITTKRFDLEKVTFLCCDIMDFQPDEVFDFVFAKDVLVHIYEDEKFLGQLNNMIAPGGRCYITTQNAFSLNCLVEGSIQRLRGNKQWRGWDPTHVRFYTAFSFEKKLQRAGFKIVRWCSIYHIPYMIVSRIITRILTGKSRVLEHPIFHFLDAWGGYFPFNRTGWYIGVVAEKC